ncbi:uncharacterized protein LOC112571992 isoform X1 [Pomacea canaliculata]|nr:uncharacterized protein LOC112571992 isoform X1 [Pomacea canaliculata]
MPGVSGVNFGDLLPHRMIATLVLLLAMSILLPSEADMGAQDLVWLEVDCGTSDENLSSTLQDLINIPKLLFVKELGTSKFIMVLREPDLAQLSLKDVTEVLPVELFDDTAVRPGVSWPPHPHISSTNLTLFTFLPSFQGQTIQQLYAELTYDIRSIGPILKNIPHEVYISKGSIPIRGYLFINMLDNITTITKAIQDIFGGPQIMSVDVSHVQILPLAN